MSRPTLRLVKGARKVATTVDQAARTFERELARVYRELSRRLATTIEQAAAGSRTAIVQASQAAQLRRDLARAMSEAGYRQLADVATGDPLDRVVRDVLATRRLAGASAQLSTGARVRLEALRGLQLEDLLDEGAEAARALWQATTRGIFGSRPVDRILDDLEDVLDGSAAEIRTLYDTSVSIYGRQVEALQAGDDADTTFAYLGPADEVTRPFCRKHVGRVYTRAQIDRLDNGQLDNVFLTGGGYNCRHTWIEIAKSSELQDLVGTKDRIPEVAEQLDELEEAA